MLLNAGPLQVHYEAGFLRTLSAGNRELVRMIYFALRDSNWQTAPVTITNERIEQTPDTFQINYDWQANDLGIHMLGQVTMQGFSNGTIEVNFGGEALSTFRRNRIGLCVLHPIVGTAGQPCRITSADGSEVNGRFPELIRPDQPFVGIQTMTWQTAFGDTLQLDVTGDVFETEDQRNWTDASFKTYSTPLALSFPVTVQAGTVIEQQVRFQPVHLAEQPVSVSVAPLIATHSQNQMLVGLGQRADGKRIGEAEAAQLRKLGLSHLRADIFLAAPDWSQHLQNAQADAHTLGILLELALFFGTNALNSLTDLLAFLEQNSVPIKHILLFDLVNRTTSDALLTQLIPTLRRKLPAVRIGGGTDANFAEFNRTRFAYDRVDFVTFSITPQAHAFDNQTIMENVAAQADVVRSAHHLTNGKPVHLSPVTLLPRFNADLPTQFPIPTPPADPRQSTDFLAAWTRASRQTLLDAGAASATYFETHGPRGVVDTETVFPVFRSLLPTTF